MRGLEGSSRKTERVLVKSADKNSNLRFQKSRANAKVCILVFVQKIYFECYGMPLNDKYVSPGLQRNVHKKRKNINPVFPFLSSYPEVIKDDTGAENISIKGNEVWLEGVDEEAGPVSVDVHTVLLQELLLVSPAV